MKNHLSDRLRLTRGLIGAVRYFNSHLPEFTMYNETMAIWLQDLRYCGKYCSNYMAYDVNACNLGTRNKVFVILDWSMAQLLAFDGGTRNFRKIELWNRTRARLQALGMCEFVYSWARLRSLTLSNSSRSRIANYLIDN